MQTTIHTLYTDHSVNSVYRPPYTHCAQTTVNTEYTDHSVNTVYIDPCVNTLYTGHSKHTVMQTTIHIIVVHRPLSTQCVQTTP